jgi:hypothetical protein
MRAARVDLLTNASSTGAAVIWPGGRGTFLASGTFGGSTVSLQVLGPDSSTWIDAGSYTTFTANGVGNFDLPQGKIRAAVTGGTPSALYAIACTIDL